MIKVICAGYIFLFVGVALSDVGRMPAPLTEPYQWWLPLLIFGVVATPAFLGYLAGREDAR